MQQIKKKINPIQYVEDSFKSMPWDLCKGKVKQFYDKIKLQLSVSQRDTLLMYIYNEIYNQCNDGICAFLRYMNS